MGGGMRERVKKGQEGGGKGGVGKDWKEKCQYQTTSSCYPPESRATGERMVVD